MIFKWNPVYRCDCGTVEEEQKEKQQRYREREAPTILSHGDVQKLFTHHVNTKTTKTNQGIACSVSMSRHQPCDALVTLCSPTTSTLTQSQVVCLLLVHVGSVDISCVQVFELWVEGNFNNTAPPTAIRASFQISNQRCDWKLTTGAATFLCTWILLSWCCVVLALFVVLLLPSHLAVGMLIHPTMVQCTPQTMSVYI